MIRLAIVVMVGTAACGPGVPGGPTMNSKMGGNDLGCDSNHSYRTARLDTMDRNSTSPSAELDSKRAGTGTTFNNATLLVTPPPRLVTITE